MNQRRIGVITMLTLLAVSVLAANPFLDAPDNKPVSAAFRGTDGEMKLGKKKFL